MTTPRKWLDREPTPEMQQAGLEAMFDSRGDLKLRELFLLVRKGWRAMFDTAPDDQLADPWPMVNLQLSRILHEMAGAVSLCWNPKPSGVFESTQAAEFVAQAIKEIRALAAPDCSNEWTAYVDGKRAMSHEEMPDKEVGAAGSAADPIAAQDAEWLRELAKLMRQNSPLASAADGVERAAARLAEQAREIESWNIQARPANEGCDRLLEELAATQAALRYVIDHNGRHRRKHQRIIDAALAKEKP